METTATNLPDSLLEAGKSHRHRKRGLLASVERRIGAIPSRLRTGLIVGGILVVGNLDLITGGEISFSIFYLVPIAAAARFHDRSTAVKTAIFAGIIWLLVELLAQPEFSHPLIPLWNAFGRTVFFLLLVGYITGVYERDAELEAEVRRKTAALRHLVSSRRTLEREMAEATAREHARIAEELHDGVGQYLAGLSYQARALAEDLESDASARAAQATRLVEMLQVTNRLLRRIDHILVPPIAGQGGLIVAFRRLAADIEQFSGVKCIVELPLDPVVIGEFQALTFFRIGQEALSNAVKHGKGRSVRLVLSHGKSGLKLVVSDEGGGFRVSDDSTGGRGLRIMRHRAELIGATLDIRSSEGAGCTVECMLPWRGARAVETGAESP